MSGEFNLEHRRLKDIFKSTNDWVDEEVQKTYIEGLEEFTKACGYEPRRWEDFYEEDETNGGCKKDNLGFLQWWMPHFGHVEDDLLKDLTGHKWDYADKAKKKGFDWN